MKRSSVIKKGLPRPIQINQKYYKSIIDNSKADEVEGMINEEILQMQINDNFKNPFKGMKEIKRTQNTYLEIQPVYMDYARQLVLDESLTTSSVGHHPMMLMVTAEE